MADNAIPGSSPTLGSGFSPTINTPIPGSSAVLPPRFSTDARAKAGTCNSTTKGNCVGRVQIDACSRPRPLHKKGEIRPTATPDDPYCVGGKPYTNVEQIPGNDPVPLMDGAGQPVIGSDGNPVYGPSRGVGQMDNIASTVDSAHSQSDRIFGELPQFGQGKKWDFQRMKDDDGSIIFSKRYVEFSNMVIGYGDAKQGPGFPAIQVPTEAVADVYAATHSQYSASEKKHWFYDSLPERIVYDIRVGRSLRASRQTHRAVDYPGGAPPKPATK